MFKRNTISAHGEVRRRRTGKRRRGIMWDYNGDGTFANERLGRFWKRYWRRWRKREDVT